MPELPEVTVISEDVASLASGREVLRAGVFRPDVTNVEPEEFESRLVGKTLRGTGRRGEITLLDFGDVVGAIHAATRDILGRAIELRGTTFDSYHDAFGETGKYQRQLKVFTRAGEPCPNCGTPIVK